MPASSASERPFTIAVFCGSSTGDDPVYEQAARLVGRTIAERGFGLVYGGGHVGLMGAVADSAVEAGAPVTGIIPQSLHEREVMHTGVDDLIVVDTMHERKMLMAERSDAFLALPGGPGTLEEIAEQWTWAQLGVHGKPCGVLNVAGYYDPLVALVATMRDRGFTQQRYTDLLFVSDELDVVLQYFLDHRPAPRADRSPGQEFRDGVVEP
jgi:uncharacterized protein (TIGR00730 family)